MDKYKVIAEKITYSLDGYITDHNNRNFGDADGWLRHVRNGWEEFIEAHPDSLNLHEYLQHQQAKVEELQKQLSEYIFVSETLDEMYVKEIQKSDELQKRVDALELKLREIAGIARRARHGEYHTESGRNAGLNIAAQLEQALKGDQYDEHRKKAEEAISKGASLTNHRIEL
ncbi:hypothetical protein [Acinetobacter baumannii]|uniref:hypothetical protein n=1 Tax=Acinetobacter baumannii TaxID=470 RepID=UPI001D0E5EBF